MFFISDKNLPCPYTVKMNKFVGRYLQEKKEIPLASIDSAGDYIFFVSEKLLSAIKELPLRMKIVLILGGDRAWKVWKKKN